jgi:hypothetical protein
MINPITKLRTWKKYDQQAKEINLSWRQDIWILSLILPRERVNYLCIDDEYIRLCIFLAILRRRRAG